jgi:anti-sigma regulatory factor (Ser/Thr protein kinase)/RimJ/RimL family protein N-acetyltransferase
MFTSCKLIIHNDYLYLAHASALIVSIAKSIGLNDNEVFRIQYASEEILSSSIESSFEVDEIEDIEVEISKISGGIEIVIRDKGFPFNPFRKKDPDISDLSYDLSQQDISEHLIQKLVDSAAYNNLGKAGKETRLVLYSQNLRIDSLIDHQTEVSTGQVTDDPYDRVRFFENEDAYNLSKLFYKSYGYSYINEIVYFPERILHNIKTGKMHSAVAVSKSGTVIGHLALYEPDSSKEITEWGMGISDPMYRGQGIMNDYAEFILKHAENLRYKGIFGHTVTTHVFSQKMSSKYDFVTCALLVGYAPSVSFKKISTAPDQRESVFVDFKYIDKPENASLFFPSKFKDIILEIYESLGVKVNQPDSESDCEYHVEQKISEEVVSALNTVNIFIHKMSTETVTEVRKITKHYCSNKIDNLFLYLNMEDKVSMSKCYLFEELGYFFAGIFPHYVFPHTMIFQYINNNVYNYEKISGYSSLAKKIKEMVRAADPNQ